ncbi:hypothetical protein, partial [Streptomyces mexicanus]
MNLIPASAVLDLTTYNFYFLTLTNVCLATARSRSPR